MTSTIHAAGIEQVRIPADGVFLEGELAVPQQAFGAVLFAHGSGSSRFSRRNQFVARILQNAGLATLLMDLLTTEEETLDQQTTELRFDIHMLARRLVAAAQFLVNHPRTLNLPIGIFGASTGGGAALVAAADAPHQVTTVVSRGGRPDLAAEALPKVKAATLLIVGGNDRVVIELNNQAYEKLNCEKRMEIIPGATHLFEEPGALEQVATLAGNWFTLHLSADKGGAMYSTNGVIDGTTSTVRAAKARHAPHK